MVGNIYGDSSEQAEEILHEALDMDAKFIGIMLVNSNGQLNIRINKMPIELLCFMKEVFDNEVRKQIVKARG